MGARLTSRFALTLAGSALIGGAALASRQAADIGAAQTAFGQSLTLRADRVVLDSSHPAMAWLGQRAPVPYTAQAALRLTLELRTTAAEPALVKALGDVRIFGGNLAEHPFPITIDLQGVPDGDYQYIADVRDGAVVLTHLQVRVKLVAFLDERHADVERRLSRIRGHDSAKATIRYPFDLARVINAGKRVFGSATNNPEFGLTQTGEPHHYDFAAGLKRTADVLAALEKGRDLVWRAGGETVRHYYMPEAGEILPYHVFVPSKWDGKAALPLVFILHGNSRDQDFYFDRDGRIIPKTAEQHGFMVVAPLGYSPNGGYNYVPYGRETSAPRGMAGASSLPQTFGPGARGFGGVNGSVTPALVRSEWSELDTMHVLDLVRQEYPIDPGQTFLFGYSAGGQGAHYLGPKFSQDWAAIGIGGSNAQPGSTYPFDKLAATPMMIFVGSEDAPNVLPSRNMTQALLQHGVPAVLKEYPGATHDSAPSAAIADLFAFFRSHPRR